MSDSRASPEARHPPALATTARRAVLVAPRTSFRRDTADPGPQPQMAADRSAVVLKPGTTEQTPVCIALEVADNHKNADSD